MKITGRQLRQIIKEELSHLTNESDYDYKWDHDGQTLNPGAAERAAKEVDDLFGDISIDDTKSQVKMPSSSLSTTADRVSSKIESILTIDNPDAAILAGKPAVQASLKAIVSGNNSISMGKRHPVVSVVKAAMQSALGDFADALKAQGAGSSAEGMTMGAKKIVTNILLGDPVDASALRYACIAVASDLGMGSSGGVPSVDFDENASNAAVIIQHLSGLTTDGKVGKNTLDAIANPRVKISI